MTETLELTWMRCQVNDWCAFEYLVYALIGEEGVYIIWCEGKKDRVVYVGQGDVRERLTAHKQDDKLLACRKYGRLLVTWATVPVLKRDGVERFLVETYKPIIGTRIPAVWPIKVNLPLDE